MVIQYPHALLRKQIKYDPTLDDQEVIDALFAAVKEEEEFHDQELIGIAANQIGIETRIILYRSDAGILTPLIEPQIEEWLVRPADPWIEVEACGSLPNYQVPVERAPCIYVTHAYPRKTSQHYFHNWEARVIQHEIDHLDGILIMDRECDA